MSAYKAIIKESTDIFFNYTLIFLTLNSLTTIYSTQMYILCPSKKNWFLCQHGWTLWKFYWPNSDQSVILTYRACKCFGFLLLIHLNLMSGNWDHFHLLITFLQRIIFLKKLNIDWEFKKKIFAFLYLYCPQS